ncbi:P-loop containing nucleoside triphosphate hydrolase protein [Bombardia bombarda]|uniref:P-loop containing nucleoside triphosphate hydrolase protein n=1 Tax=Bombardia bombarda TaxID=252184 RepID=A0AA39X8K8_9PEZI|nr:P-loop containing nucleoside triphosphate hydrolase protein [Bombardia bombarda]
MARGQPLIKREPNSSSLRAIGGSRQTPATTIQTAPSETRGARSGAPSVDTRPPPPSALGSFDDEDEDDDDECMLMEVKPVKLKSEAHHEIPGSQSMQASFIGPNRALKDFGQKLKDINDALGELQARGIQHFASLPELVLVGDQSSGKSSLMSAIAGLSLPRSSGTCTRCPIHIRVSRADEWSCRVFLKQDYEFQPPDHPITIRDVTKANKFPPWVKLDSNQQARHEFKTIRDRFDSEEIETVLRCAQVAILNPTTSHRSFIPKTNGEVSEDARQQHMDFIASKEANAESQFSPNTVALEVTGPDLADLNFYDLPGVFITAKRSEDRFLERVVQNLTCEYISRKSAIILWAVPMNQDAENSYASKLIREMGAGDRCVGVMTKADLLPNEAQASSSWLSMLNGQAHRTGLGYFITSRQGTDPDLDEQNKLEEAFFNGTADSTGYWPNAFDQFKDRCGIEKLKSFLSLKLGEEFSKVLPEVTREVNKRLHEVTLRLQTYPDPPANPEMEIITSLAEFSIRVKDRVMHQDFVSQWSSQMAEPFKRVILSLKPKFKVNEPEFVDLNNPASYMRKRPGPDNVPTTPSKRPRGGLQVNGGQVNGGQTNGDGPVKVEELDRVVFTPTSQRRLGSPNTSFTPSSTPGRGPSTSKNLMEIRSIIRRSAIPGQPGLVPTSVYEPLYTEAARSWGPHLEQFIAQTFGLLNREVMQTLDSAFPNLKNRAIYTISKQLMAEFLDCHRKELRDQLLLIYSLESHRLFTLDDESLARNKASEKKILERHRHIHRWAHRTGENVGRISKIEELTEEELAQEALRMQKEVRQLGADPYDQEVSVAAYVRGYYLTAANRFIDYVAMHVMSGLFSRISLVIKTYLPEKLGLNDRHAAPEILDRLISEGPETAKMRMALMAEKEKLDQAMAIIVNLEKREAAAATPRNDNGGAGGGAIHPELSMRTNGNSSRGDRTPIYSATTAYGEA